MARTPKEMPPGWVETGFRAHGRGMRAIQYRYRGASGAEIVISEVHATRRWFIVVGPDQLEGSVRTKHEAALAGMRDMLYRLNRDRRALLQLVRE